MQIEQWGVTFASWPAAGVLAGAPVDLRALGRCCADRFVKEHPGMCWLHHLKGACSKKDCAYTHGLTHGERIAFV